MVDLLIQEMFELLATSDIDGISWWRSFKPDSFLQLVEVKNK